MLDACARRNWCRLRSSLSRQHDNHIGFCATGDAFGSGVLAGGSGQLERNAVRKSNLPKEVLIGVAVEHESRRDVLAACTGMAD